jgi:RIO-like serine/threonine protein kinase
MNTNLTELQKEILTYFKLSNQFKLNYTRTPLDILKEKCKKEYEMIKRAFKTLEDMGFIEKKNGKYHSIKGKRKKIREFLEC